MLTVTIRAEDGTILGGLMLDLRTFRTGSRSYFGSKKITHEGKRYQLQVQAVEIGSKKPAPDSQQAGG